MKGFAIAFLLVILLGAIEAINEQRASIAKLEADLSAVYKTVDARLHALEEASISDIYDLNLIGVRTTCLRQTLETLVSTWPGRAKLPEPCGSWPAWPRPGDSLEER